MRICIHPALLIYLAVLAVFSSWESCVCAMVALLVHELGHGLAGKMAGERFERIEFTPFGGVMHFAPGTSPLKGIRGAAIAAAGPAANYLLLLGAGLPAIQRMLGPHMIRQMISANAVMLGLNLLPALPLDGGRMVFCIGYYVFRVSTLIAVLSWMGVLSGAAMLALAAYGAVKLGLVNCSLLIVGGYLMVCAVKSRGTMLVENLYAVIHERCADASGIRPMELFRVPADALLFTLLEPMERTRAAAFVYEDENGQHLIGEHAVCRALLETPAAPISQLQEENHEKSAFIPE